MYSLFIDTHSSDAIVVLYKNGQILCVEKKKSDKSHSAVLMPLIDNIFAKNKLTANVLNEVIVVSGPGSFTGIRIGIIVAKTFCFALNIPLKEIDYFQVLSCNVQSTNKQIIVKDPKGCFEALFNESNDLLEDYKYLSKEKFVKKEEFYFIDESLEIDYTKVYDFCKDMKAINAHAAKPLYIKKIEVEK